MENNERTQRHLKKQAHKRETPLKKGASIKNDST